MASTSQFRSAARTGKPVLYAAVGSDFFHFDADLEACTLSKKSVLHTPYRLLKFAWPDPGRAFLYAGCTNAPFKTEGDSHHLSAYRIDRRSGELSPHGAAAPLPSAVTHLTVDIPGKHILGVYRRGMVTVNRIEADGTVGDAVTQPEGLDVGIFSHQVRVSPANDSVIVTARGYRREPNKPEDPGSLNLLSFHDGVLRQNAKVAPGLGFGPRNVDFHPTKPWLYVGMELQNQIRVYKFQGGELSPQPLFVKDTMARSAWVSPSQIAGQIHVHPSGQFVYVANRSSATVDFEGRPFFTGGDNDIAVFAINQETGEPTLIQNEGTRGIYPFSFCLDPSGRMLVAANASAFEVRDSGVTTATVPACLSAFRIRDDGTLEFIAKYDVETRNGDMLFWVGLFML